MSKHLLIVESPHKAKVISGFLSSDWIVKSSVGHIRDLPLPKKMTKQQRDRYGDYAIDVNSGKFEPLFKVSYGKNKVVDDLKTALKKVDDVYLAMDPDREGEAIAWHVKEVLKTNKPVHRVSWNEVTEKAVKNGLKNKTAIDQPAVDAALSRSFYDRLFGFTLSPVLWKTIAPGTSGGRVQSPALRLIVDREKERLKFVKSDYYSLTGSFLIGEKNNLDATLLSIGKNKIATGSSFDSNGKTKNNETILTDDNIGKTKSFLQKREYEVSDVSTKPYTRNPAQPYTTSKFQQDVGNRTNMGSKQLMNIAQKLFDAGFISYMRTDSPHLGEEALKAARGEAIALFGKANVPSKPVIYKAKGQGGHEAIRPVCGSNGRFRDPKTIKQALDKIDKKAFKVYECIYNRTVASQMNPATGFTTTVKISSTDEDVSKKAVFGSSATTYTDLGFMLLTKPTGQEEASNVISDKIVEKDSAVLKKLADKKHSTQPPARYSEPQLVDALEKNGIGRPSTYATIVTVNQDRGYVNKKGGRLYPTWAGMKVAQYLESNIPNFVAYEATAQMEKELDKIELGQLQKMAFLKKEWDHIQKDVLSLNNNIDWDEINKISIIDLYHDYQVRVNKYGAWLEKKDDKPNSKGFIEGVKLADGEDLESIDFTDPEECRKLYENSKNKKDSRVLGELDKGEYKGWNVSVRDGKYGTFLQAVDPEGKDKPVNHPIPDGLDMETVTLEDIESLFEEVKLPRHLSGNFFVGIGKKGSYIGYKKTAKSRKAEFISLSDEHDPRKISLKEVEEIWSEAKK